MHPSSILDNFRRRESLMIDAIHELVEIESPSFDVGQSVKVADWIENYVSELGLQPEIERIDEDGIGRHLVLRFFPSSEKQTLLLGHTDTVHPVGTALKNPTRIEGDKFFGCGIFDMKANIVLMFEALRFIRESDQKTARPVTMLLSCDEEVGSFTGRPLVDREAANAAECFVLEPSFNGMVKTGRKGTGMFTIRVQGLPAHAGLEPEKGASAILEIARQIEKINALNDSAAGTSANVCTIKGGTTTNVIPEHAEATIDVRFTSLAEAARIESALRDLNSCDSRVSIKIEGAINRPPLERTREVAALYEKAQRLAASIGYELGEKQVGGASDGNFVAAAGVPVLDGLGVAGDGAHTLNEYIKISDISKRAALVTMMLM